jgi:hypothetical protein
MPLVLTPTTGIHRPILVSLALIEFHLTQYPNITVGVDNKNTFLTYFHTHMIPFTGVYDSKRQLIQGIQGETDYTQLTRCLKE